MSKLGLKLANGAFYPVLEEGVSARKRLVLTTVKDNQPSVQIDLYRQDGPRVSESSYLGSLVVEDIPLGPKGKPDIRLDLGLGDDGTLSAVAVENETGERRSFSITLEALAEEEKYEIPDFEFEEEEPDSLPAESFSLAEDEGLQPSYAPSNRMSHTSSARPLAEEEMGEPELPVKSRKNPLIIALFAIIALLVVLAFSFLVYRCGLSNRGATVIGDAEPASIVATAAKTEPAPVVKPAPVPAPPAQAASQAQSSTPTPTTVATESKPAAAPAVAKPAASSPVAPKPAEVRYKIKWGDTLWDLSYVFYRNPWLYTKIAKANKIKNPDRILAGRTILIPAR